jgi:purine-binding chemotaxis protein CheW
VSGLHVRVRAANEQYALPVSDVLEVAELGEVTPVPGAGATVMGVRNLRGQVVPIVDLARVLGLPPASAPERIVIAEDAGRKAGLAVDEVLGVEELPEPSEAGSSPHVGRAALAEGALVGFVDIPSVLDSIQELTENDRA